jgi:molybdate transport system ATP-binding protein
MIEMNISQRLSGAEGEFDLNFETKIPAGELVALYGPSGAGKSSVLKMLAGLMTPRKGWIKVDGEVWFDEAKHINRKPQLRNLGMVFQDYSLFPNMSVRGNLEFALQKGQPKKEVDLLLGLTELKSLQHKMPQHLSGGQKQRVALARALVRKPKILLLDEPLSALHSEMRQKLQNYVFEFHERFGLTTLLVSHDYNEVIKLSKRMLLLEDGRITQDGSPRQILGNPVL